MQQKIVQKALNSLKRLKLEFSDEKMEQDYRSLKKENITKDFKICLQFLIVFNLWVVLISVLAKAWVEVYIAVGTVGILSIIFLLRRYLKNYIQIVTLLIILAYDISRLFMLQSTFKNPNKSVLFHAGYTLSSIQGILLFRLLKVSHKGLGLIILIILRYVIVSIYVAPGSFFWPLFTRHCFIDGFVFYTFYNHESTFRKIYQDFNQKKEELLKFKELLAESLPQSLTVVAYDSNDLLFSNKAFDNTFGMYCSPSILAKEIKPQKSYLESMLVDQSTIRDATTNCSNLTFLADMKHPLTLVEVLNKLSSQDYLSDKTISLAASITKNQTRRLFEVTLKKVKWDSKDAIAILFNDITYQENLIALKMANVNKDKIIATVSHELRTPLNGIIGILDITKKKTENPEIIEFLSLCKDNAHLLLSLVNSILDLQQISAGKLKLNPANVDIRKVIDSISRLFYFQCKEKSISLDCDIQDDVPAIISTDENRLKQVLINLIGNSIKFTSKGGVKINIALNPVNINNVQISVSDTGIGIRHEDQKRLFKMYSRIEDGESVNKNGVGLGLTISNALVLLLNGGADDQGIHVESNYGIGSRFYFEIQRNLKEKKEVNLRKTKTTFELEFRKQATLNGSDTSRGLLAQKTNSGEEQKIEEDFMAFEYSHQNDFNEFFAPSNIQSRLSSYKSVKSVKRINTFSNFKHHNESSPLKEIVPPSEEAQPTPIHSPCFPKKFSLTEEPTLNLDILIVDDNPFNLLVAKNLIQEFKYNIQTALGGQEAIEIVKNNFNKGIVFKVIFMDCQMPIMDGFETTKTLRVMMEKGEIPEMPIFGWTANNSEEDVKRCYEVGMVGHLPKPASKADFSQVISQLDPKSG